MSVFKQVWLRAYSGQLVSNGAVHPSPLSCAAPEHSEGLNSINNSEVPFGEDCEVLELKEMAKWLKLRRGVLVLRSSSHTDYISVVAGLVFFFKSLAINFLCWACQTCKWTKEGFFTHNEEKGCDLCGGWSRGIKNYMTWLKIWGNCYNVCDSNFEVSLCIFICEVDSPGLPTTLLQRKHSFCEILQS